MKFNSLKILAIDSNQENHIQLNQSIHTNFLEAIYIPCVDAQLGLSLAIEHKPTLIFIEVHLPKLSGLELAKQLKSNEITAHIPILFFSNARLTQAERVSAIKLSGRAYLHRPFKEEELIAYIETIFAIAETNSETTLPPEMHKTEILFKKTELIANIGYWTLNLHTKTLTVSEGARKIYGFFHETITLDDVMKARLPQYNKVMDQALQDLISGTKPYDVTYKIKRKTDGAILDIQSKADFHLEENQVFGIIKDITEQVQQLDELAHLDQKWRQVIESAPIPMAINDSSQNITFINSAFTQVFGYTLQDIPSLEKWFLNAYPNPVQRKRAEEKWDFEMARFKETGIPVSSLEFEISCKNGSKKSVLINNSWLENSESKNHLVVLYDITERKKDKEKQLEYLQVLEGVLNSIDVRVFWKDKNLNYLGCNKSFAMDAGCQSAEEIIGKNDFELAWKDQAKLYQNDDLSVIESGQAKINIEEPQSTPEGKTITLLTSKIPLVNSEGKINGVIGTYTDITARKLQENALAKNQLYLQALLQSTNDGILAIGQNNEVLYTNVRFAEISKMPIELIKEGSAHKLLAYIINFIEDAESFKKNIEAVDNSNNINSAIVKFKDGRTLEHNTHPLILNGQSIGRVYSIRDISERQLAETKIRQKDIEFQKLSANVSDLIYQFTRRPDGNYFVPIASQGIKNIFGCTPEDVLESFEPIAKVIHPDDKERVINEIENSAKNLSFFNCEFRVQIPGKETQWVYSKSNPELLEDGSVTWYGFNTDITLKKNAQKALEESNKRYNLVSMATHDSIWELDISTGKILGNENGEKESKIDLLIHTLTDWLNLIHPDDFTAFVSTQQSAFNQPKNPIWQHEYRMLNKLGNFVYVNSKGYIVRDNNGKAIQLIGATQDISERMTHVKAIEMQNKKLREIAWIQSHIVRAPLARIMGLIDIIEIEEDLPNDLKELLGYILTSAHEFDKIIRSISDKSQVENLVE